ncbi:MAG TPA: type II toxin-antitoxin system VapC family toxin [Pirellulales bacterium]|nr:type II toxin-antitoxin system VapC family toxin [Pirellulales bacterium]
MKLLLDTHAFLWFVTSDSQLSATALALIADVDNELFLSPASYWEVAIKVSIGKYPLTVPFETFFTTALAANGIQILAVEIRHAAVLSALPMHHKDPFDRMIAAQALSESIPVVSADAALDSYGITRLW